MKTSAHLEEVLFAEPNPATDKVFEEKSNQIFQHPRGDSFVDLYIHRPCSKDDTTDWISSGARAKTDKDAPDVSVPSEPCSPIDLVDFVRYGRESPPVYVGQRGLDQQRLRDASALGQAALVHAHSPIRFVSADDQPQYIQTRSHLRIWYVCCPPSHESFAPN